MVIGETINNPKMAYQTIEECCFNNLDIILDIPITPNKIPTIKGNIIHKFSIKGTKFSFKIPLKTLSNINIKGSYIPNIKRMVIPLAAGITIVALAMVAKTII